MLDLLFSAADFIPQQLVANGSAHLTVEIRHALRFATLPWLHRDPFDRILIAQAFLEELPLLSADTVIAQYGTPLVW